MEIDPNNLQDLVQRQMFEDPSGGIINLRIMLQFFEMCSKSNMTEDERADVFDLLHVISLKLVSVWTHNHRYELREKEMISACEGNPTDRRKNEPMRFASAQDLYIEWDGFLVQCKSVLDHMINILYYTLVSGDKTNYAIQWNSSDDPKKPRWKMIHGAIVQQMINTGEIDPSKIK